MQRYQIRGKYPNTEQDHVESPRKVEAFLDEIEEVCRKHGLSLSHEDGHGAFQIEPFDEFNIDWLRQAQLSDPDRKGFGD